MKEFSDDIKNALTLVSGNNFSGRSRYLQKEIPSIALENRVSHVHVGELPANYITGVLPVVRQEMQLHISKASDSVRRQVEDLFATYAFHKHFSKNPFNLSGGEMTVLTILSSLLLEPSILTIDTTIEQLHENWRKPLLEAIQSGKFPATKCYISDNRLKDYALSGCPIIQPEVYTSDFPYSFHPIDPSIHAHNTQAPVTVELKNLNFSYRHSDPIFRDLSLILEPGNIYHLKGHNGAGKSTLAKILSGLLKIKPRTFFLNGAPYIPFHYPGQVVGYSFQNPDEQLFSRTVEDEVLRKVKKEKSSYTERREAFLTMFGLQSIRKHHPAELPFTIRKRIALASTLASERPWYVLDEPTLGQDDTFVKDFSTILRNMAQAGKGIIIISHAKAFSNNLTNNFIHLEPVSSFN